MGPSAIGVLALVLYLRFFIKVHHLDDPEEIADILTNFSIPLDFSLLEEAFGQLNDSEIQDIEDIGEFYKPEIELEYGKVSPKNIFSFFLFILKILCFYHFL